MDNILYQKIMRSISQDLKHVLNESSNSPRKKPIIRTEEDLALLKRRDFKRFSDHSKGINFYIDLSYIFPDGNWEDPIVPATFEYFYSSRGIDNNWSEIDVKCPDEMLEDKGYSRDDLDDYLYDDLIYWFYDFLDL